VDEKQMITFEDVTENTLYIAEEIINSNQTYNELENGKRTRTVEEIRASFNEHETQITKFIKLDDTYIGIIDYLPENPKDGLPWIGLLMIHNDYKGYGFGTNAYLQFELELIEKGLKTIRLGVLEENKKAINFWESLRYVQYSVSTLNGNKVIHFEKEL
jgi:ribosomal protein S18 acetylase RimI-like enzyme